MNPAILVFDQAKQLLVNAGYDPSLIFDVLPVKGGGNNQIFLIKHTQQSFILKRYFQNSHDERRRLEAEYDFIEFAYEKMPDAVPKPYAKDGSNQLALYEFIPGHKISNSSLITANHVKSCADFVANVNNEGSIDNQFQYASEACFSIRQHIDVVEARLNELNINLHSDISCVKTLEIIQSVWVQIKTRMLHRCALSKIDSDELIPESEVILSPSDFGFHNVIVKPSGQLVFIDFEYAGLDDPAKLIGDFFAQVAVPVNQKYLDIFIERLCVNRADSVKVMNRAKLLLNLYKIKWCCIVLNIFLPANLSRRLFAQPDLNVELLRKSQLDKVHQLLNKVNHDLY